MSTGAKARDIYKGNRNLLCSDIKKMLEQLPLADDGGEMNERLEVTDTEVLYQAFDYIREKFGVKPLGRRKRR